MKRNSQSSHRGLYKTLKVLAAICLCILLLASEGILMCMFSVDKALTRDSIKSEIVSSAMMDEYMDEALADSTVNDAGRYGEIIKAVLHTDAMNSFFADYMTGAIRAQLYGEEYEEVANDELMNAFSQGIDEVNQEESAYISPLEEEYLKQQMEAEIPHMTDSLNQIAGNYQAADGAATEDTLASEGSLGFLASAGYRAAAALACLAFSAGLVALFWRSRMGFLWCGIMTALASTTYAATALAGRYIAADNITSSTDAFIVGLAENGLGFVAVAGYIASAVLIALFIVLRLRRKGKSHEKIA